MFRTLVISGVAALTAMFVTQQADAAVAYPVTGQISLVQNGGPVITPLADGNNLWVTSLTWKNNGPAELANVNFINDEAWLNNQFTSNAQWSNATQQWIDNNYFAFASNPSTYVTLSPSITDTSIPSGFGLSSTDSVPAFLISSDLAPGASVTTDVNFELSPNITLFYFNGSIVGTPVAVPEPVSLSLFGTGLIGLGLLRRRKRHLA